MTKNYIHYKNTYFIFQKEFAVRFYLSIECYKTTTTVANTTN